MSRAGYVGDELGSADIGALVRDAMNLAFMLERTYPPGGKMPRTKSPRVM